MKTKIPLLGLLGLAVALAVGGCASVPRVGSLVYFDSGYIWYWQEGYGWRYLGERQVRITRNHVPVPFKPGVPGEKPPVHHHPPGPPGTTPPGGRGTCYFFFDKNGSVLTSNDGSSFWTVGHFDASGQYVSGSEASGLISLYHGYFNGVGNSFAVGTKPSGGFSRWLAVTSNGGMGESGTGYSRGSSGSDHAADYAGGNRGSGESRSFSGGGGGSYSGGGFSGGGYSGGGGGGGYSGGGSHQR